MIHLLEDDLHIGTNLEINIKLDGYQVVWSKSIAEAKENLECNNFQLMLFDVNLPDGSGFDLCREIRESNSSIPILFLTAQSDEASVVEGFSCGGSDYIKKPFSLIELRARLKAWYNRASSNEYKSDGVEGLVVNKESRSITIHNIELSLNRREYDILIYLIERIDSIVTREDIIEAIQLEIDVSDRTIDSHISRLRGKLKKANLESYSIKSEYGLGYRMVKNV